MPAELSDIAFQRYEALYEKELYTTKAYAMFGHEHQQYARRKVYEAIIAECSTPSEIREPMGLFWQTADGRWHFCPGVFKRGDIHDNGRPIRIAYAGEEAPK